LEPPLNTVDLFTGDVSVKLFANDIKIYMDDGRKLVISNN